MDNKVSFEQIPAVDLQVGDVLVVDGVARGVSYIGDRDYEAFDVEVVAGRNEYRVFRFETDGYVQVVRVHREGFLPCNVCPVSAPGAVSWGCTCGKTAEQVNAEAVEFARIHD